MKLTVRQLLQLVRGALDNEPGGNLAINTAKRDLARFWTLVERNGWIDRVVETRAEPSQKTVAKIEAAEKNEGVSASAEAAPRKTKKLPEV